CLRGTRSSSVTNVVFAIKKPPDGRGRLARYDGSRRGALSNNNRLVCHVGHHATSMVAVSHSHHVVKKNRTRWKNTGAAKYSESRRSMMPPWPGIVEPKSSTPRSRLMELMTSPPAKPSRQETKASPAACSGLNGVSHHRAAPIPVALNTPPMNPSQVLLGLTLGATGCLRSVLPHTYCRTSLICTTRTKKSNSFAPAGPAELTRAPWAPSRPSAIAVGRCRIEGTKLMAKTHTMSALLMPDERSKKSIAYPSNSAH